MLCAVENPNSALLFLEWPHQKTKYLIGAVIHKRETRHKVPKSVLRAVLGRMQFTLRAARRTPHGASRLVQAGLSDS